MLGRQPGRHRATLGSAKAPRQRRLRRRLNVTPHVAQNTSGRRAALDGRPTRHPSYAASQRLRQRIEEAFGWIKSCGGPRKTRRRGTARVGWTSTLTAAACNLVRLPRLLAVA